MAIVEAASCGLQVVSTRVGGIPEVLPANLICLTDVTVDALYNGVFQAIQCISTERQKHMLNGHRKPSSDCLNTNHINNTNKVRKRLKDSSIDEVNRNQSVLCPYKCNEIIRQLYNWQDVTRRTERVYRRVLKEKDPPFGEKLNCYLKTCMPFVLVVSFSYLFLKFLDIFSPRRYIDFAEEFPISRNKTRSTKPKTKQKSS